MKLADQQEHAAALVVGDKVMMPADLKRLHKYMLEVEHIDLVFNYRHHVAAYPPGRVHRAVPPTKIDKLPSVFEWLPARTTEDRTCLRP